MDEELIEVLYNSTYGGYDLSDKAKKLFEERKTNEDSEYDRDTPLMLQIFHELGDEFDGSYCKVKIKKIPKKYKNFYEITDYDGREDVVIDEYQHDFESILRNESMTDSEKIIKLKEMIYN